MGFRPSDRDVFAKIAGLALNAGEVFISLRAFSEELGYARETICRSAKRLAQKGLIRFVNKKKHGIFSIVEVLPVDENLEAATDPSFDVPLTKRSTIVDRQINDHCPDGQPQLNNINNLKQQHVDALGFSNKKAVIEKLKSFGIAANESKRLLARFPLDRVERQIAHLEAKIKNNDEVKNQAGWLIKAIRQDYPESQIIVAQKQQAEESEKAEQLRKASQMSKDADYLLSSGKPKEAINAAQKSLELHETSLAKDVIQKAQNEIAQKKQQEEAVAALSSEAFAQIVAEEEEKQQKSLLRLGITKFGEMAKKAAYFSAVDRALKASQR